MTASTNKCPDWYIDLGTTLPPWAHFPEALDGSHALPPRDGNLGWSNGRAAPPAVGATVNTRFTGEPREAIVRGYFSAPDLGIVGWLGLVVDLVGPLRDGEEARCYLFGAEIR